jgi:Protein of unknown function (DUF3828)
MPTRRSLLFILGAGLFALPGWPTIAADASALEFVTAIYDAYKGKDAKGVPLDSARTVRRYFEPSLAALINKDRAIAARHRDVGLLDGDPFIDAQDWEIGSFDIAVRDTAPGKASATVTFTNLGKPSTVVLDLVKIKNDWRIGDIAWQRDETPKTLRGLYGKK